jgi:UDPglucose--hexose-1-phosphate uridylyltransferase
MQQSELIHSPHRRKNILTGEWVLVSPQRTQRPWQGEISALTNVPVSAYESECYLCPGNKRANGEINPQYANTYVFTNDFSALLADVPQGKINENDLLIAKSENGICRVVNFSPRHDLTLAEMKESEIEDVITIWQDEFKSLGKQPHINYVQIFENKGSIMGNSNPHPHGQIWAQESIPMEPLKELKQFRSYYSKKKRSLLADYLKLELRLKERVVFENASFAIVTPFWAVWPYETMILSKRKIANILELRIQEKKDFAQALRVVTVKYDNLFKTAFPYSAGLHQAPTDGKDHGEWHLHMHFYPPLLRSASIKKFMVGYEMLAEPQRDITPEYSAKILKELSLVHYKVAQH